MIYSNVIISLWYKKIIIRTNQLLILTLSYNIIYWSYYYIYNYCIKHKIITSIYFNFCKKKIYKK